jgi:hypothetical protein
MYINTEDEIVETRTWSSGTEIVARVNWSQIARVRRVLGLAGEEFRQGQFIQQPKAAPVRLRLTRGWQRPEPRAA